MSRTQVGRSALALTLVLVAALAGIGLLAWVVVRGNSTRGTKRAGDLNVELPSDLDTGLSADTTPLEVRRAEEGEAGAGAGQGAAASTTGTGTLRIHVLDEETRTPIPDLQFVAYRERGGHKNLGHGKTDSDGRAELREVEANTVIVRTERRPPYAGQSGAVWLVPGVTKELEILVGAGGVITGRVVDDLKLPCPGAGVRFTQAQDAEIREPDAIAGPDGRFRIEHASCTPCNVWIVHGEMQPESRLPVHLTARLGDILTYAQAQALPGKEVDIGDVVLPRTATFAGRVVDAQGMSVAGAVLSKHLWRLNRYSRMKSVRKEDSRAPIGDTDFFLNADEQLTDASGRFETHGNPLGFTVIVQTLSGQAQDFRLPRIEPGTRKDDIELKLDTLTRLELELVDAQGALVRGPAPSRRSAWEHQSNPPLWVEAYDKAGLGAGSHTHCETDGLWRVDVHRAAAEIAVIEIGLDGYRVIHDDVCGRISVGTHLRYVLTELPSFRVRLVAKDPAAIPIEDHGQEIALHLCMATPAQRTGRDWKECCGFGAYWSGSWRGEPRDVVLCVMHSAPFWIYAGAKDWNQQFHTVACFGPFEPGDELHELALDPHDFISRPKDPDPADSPAGPEAHEQQTSHRGHILRESGEVLMDAYVMVQPASSIGLDPRARAQTGADGSFELTGELPPRMLLRVSRRVVRESVQLYEWQLYALDEWPVGEVQELRFAKARPVVVSVLGLDPESSNLVPGVCPAAGEPTARCDHRRGTDPVHYAMETGVRLPGPRAAPQRYVFLLAPGRYQFWGSNLMHELPVTELEVAPGEGDLELSITSH